MKDKVRICRRCVKCSWRQFADPKVVCPEHGSTTTFTDQNRPHFGQPTEQAPGYTRVAFEKAAARIQRERDQ